ncbi:MAG TPA: GatB/YqeY domain-containing protein [Longimicrobiales bacterium]|nr:GatB/YqeY domain-containing protein [Longimicrobiales bacterium]
MSELSDRLRSDLNSARRERDRLRTMVLSMTLAELRNREIELGRAATDADVVDVVGRAMKRRREAAEQIRAAGRPEMADREESEAVLLAAYMPEQLTEDEVRAFVRDAVAGGASNVGAVMSAVMPKVKGRFDGRETNRIVREELG